MFAPLQDGLQDLFLFFKNAVCVSRNSVFNIPFVTVGHIHLPLVARSAPNLARGCVLKRILRPLAESHLVGQPFYSFRHSMAFHAQPILLLPIGHVRSHACGNLRLFFTWEIAFRTQELWGVVARGHAQECGSVCTSSSLSSSDLFKRNEIEVHCMGCQEPITRVNIFLQARYPLLQRIYLGLKQQK